MDEKLKSENMQQREQSGQADVENGAMLTTYLFRYTPECTILQSNFQNFLRLRRQGGIDPPSQNPADAVDGDDDDDDDDGHSVDFGLCEQHHKTVEELVEEADDKLFTNVTYNKQHVLHSTLAGTMDTKYHLRPRPHTFKLAAKNSSITVCDFITRMLFKDVY